MPPASPPTTSTPSRPAGPIPSAPAPRRLSAATSQRLIAKWFTLFALLLAGLAIGGKGFAYVGLPPLFISEITLGLGVLAFLVMPRWRETLAQPVSVLILLLLGWGMMRTLPHVDEYRFDAARDFMLLGYMVTAILAAGAIMSQPRLLPWLLSKYRVFAVVFLIVMPPLWVISVVAESSIPRWPWADVGIITIKPGDVPIHLGAIAAASILGFTRNRSLVWIGLMCLMLGATGAVNRGGLVAFSLAFAIAFLMRPKSSWTNRLAITMVVVVTLVALSGISVKVPGRDREFSAQQLLLNVTSVIGTGEGAGDLNNTKTWRLDWWGTIADYTLFGDYFWTGKGFGVNLANSDGFQVHLDDESLRSPHNGHFNVLARAGVPGFVLWCAILATWCYTMLNAYLRARQRGDRTWAIFFVFLVAYWVALCFNASVDVFFEGPMGGVWYWAVTGIGFGSAWVYQRYPEVLNGFETQPGRANRA